MTTDYHDFTTIDTTKEQRNKIHVGSLWINSWRCNACGDEPRSKNKHHMVSCECGAISVDGGSHYSKLSGDINNATSLCVDFNDVEGQG